jgi:xanthine dehydrogenase YagR molybdenum-binding subunit
MSVIGAPLSRVDGRMKVTGTAKYSAEFQIPHIAYAVLVQSTVPAGRIDRMDTAEAEHAPGVITILKPGNAPRLPKPEDRISLLQDDSVHYNNQPIAVVVAEALHQAHHAASLIRTQHKRETPKLDFIAGFPSSYLGSHTGIPGDVSFGDVDSGLQQARSRSIRSIRRPSNITIDGTSRHDRPVGWRQVDGARCQPAYFWRSGNFSQNFWHPKK